MSSAVRLKSRATEWSMHSRDSAFRLLFWQTTWRALLPAAILTGILYGAGITKPSWRRSGLPRSCASPVIRSPKVMTRNPLCKEMCCQASAYAVMTSDWDVSVIGKDNSRLCEASNPQLTSLDSQLYDCSFMAVQMLINVLNHRIKTHGILLDSSIVLRGTLWLLWNIYSPLHYMIYTAFGQVFFWWGKMWIVKVETVINQLAPHKSA